MEVIAERELLALFPNGEAAKVILRIGRPVTHRDGDWACPVQAEGLRLWQGPTEIRGVGSWHALMCGQRFLRNILTAEVEQGAVFHWEDGEHPIDIEELFVLHEIG